jgi:signal transduction histidine kinase
VVGLLIEDVLIEQALQGEADHYWQRMEKDADAALPDTMNLTAYRRGFGATVPVALAGLQPGFHRRETPQETITYVSDHGGERLYLVFESEQVDELVLLFGTVPLALALIVIYLSTWLAYRVSRRAVSPVVNLAQRVRTLDPARPDPAQLRDDPAFEADEEIRVLASALEDLVTRVTEFAERERRFTRDASHELRTPLTVIKMAVDRLSRHPGLDESAQQTLQRIRSSADDMEHLTRAFLLLARETDQGLAREWVCVNDIVGSEIEQARLLDPDKPVSVHIRQEARLEVFAPERIVESVLGNLLRNAIAYTDEGEVSVSITADSVVIEDTGAGMEAEVLEKVFRPHVSQQRQRGGFGVGLTIVQRLTDRFRWPLRIDSDPGKGTRVSVRFPGSRSQPVG